MSQVSEFLILQHRCQNETTDTDKLQLASQPYFSIQTNHLYPKLIESAAMLIR